MKQALYILSMLFFFFLSAAQNNQVGELHFNHLFVKDGMPEGRVSSIVQDKEGYMWIATQKGLVRYDGYRPKVYNFDMEDPYMQDIVVVYLDREGRLWAGGKAGVLFLYDRSGDRFIKYQPNVYAADSSFGIWAIHQDKHAHLWLACFDFIKRKNRLERFDLATNKFIPYDKDEKGRHYINATDFVELFEDEKGTIWDASDNGIYRYNEKTDQFDSYLANADSTKQNTFYSLLSRQGFLWMGVHASKPPFEEEGLWRYDAETNTATIFRHRIGDSSSIGNDNVHWIYNDSLGRFWITTDNGLSLFDPVKNNFINYSLKDNSTGNFIPLNEIKEDKNGNFWLGTIRRQGLVFFNTQSGAFTRYLAQEKDPYGLASNDVLNLFIDHSGTLWFGAAQIGLEWTNKQLSRFIRYADDPGQPHQFHGGLVNFFAEARDSTIWLGSAQGLYHWRPITDSFSLVRLKRNQEKDFSAGVVMIDHEGLVWCAGFSNLNSGLYCYNAKTGKIRYFNKNKKDSTSLSSDYVSALLEDHLGNIWVGTYQGGICRFNRQSQNFTRFPYIENNGFITQNHGALDDKNVLSMYEDKNGTLWVGTNFGGLNRLNRESGTFTSYSNQLPGFKCVISIYEDDQNKIWAGTYFGGVFSFDPVTGLAIRYTEKDGLLYEGATGILADKKNNLWLSSERGISIFNSQTKQTRNVTTANGLPSETLFGAFKTSGGRFLFNSGDGGFISINPDDFTPDPQPPFVHVESIDFVTLSHGKRKDSTLIVYGRDSINLRYDENRLTFHYVGLYYQNPQLNQYACKLEGYDKDWIAEGTQRIATYTNLSAGHYIFRVKASNSDGVWNEQGDSFSFTILPPWWQTWWAYTLYILLFALAVWVFAAYRSRNLRRVNQVLEEKVAHRTGQLNQSIEDLKSTQSQLIQSEKMASLGELTAGIAHEIQNPLNFVNNFSEVNKELIDEASQANDSGNSNEVKELLSTLKENEEKIIHHGKRADAIVKGMLQHSRSSTGRMEPTDINALADEYLRLTYHGLRAKDKSFNAVMKTDLDNTMGKINIVPQDIGRAILNLINNAFYAVDEKKKSGVMQYTPTVTIATKRIDGKAEISIKDNGNGIPQKVVDKIFQPFFTTKPTEVGTGLGLSLSYDIIKSHHGEIKVQTKEGEGSEFVIQLPLTH